MTMDDFEFGVPMEGMDAMPEGLPEAALDVPGPAEDGADALIPRPPEDGGGQGGVEAVPSPEEPPKKKRASRKKADKPEEPPTEDAAGPVEDGGTPPMAEDAAPVERLPEADQLDPEAGGRPQLSHVAEAERTGPGAHRAGTPGVERHLRLLPRQIGAHRADYRRGRAGVQCP